MSENGKKIAQFMNTLDEADGGPARNALELNQALNRVGAHVQLVSFGVNRSLLSDPSVESVWRGPAVIGPLRSWWKDKSFVAAFKKAIFEADRVIVHGYYLPWVPLVVFLATIARKPVALMPHGALTDHQGETSRYKKLLWEIVAGWWTRRWISVFVTGSEREASEIRHRWRWISVERAGVGTAFASLPNGREQHVPARLVTLSRLTQKKRIDLCIDAVRILREAGIDAFLSIAGTGESALLRELQDHVSRFGLEDRISFLGHVSGDRKHDLLSNSDVFLLPSDDENFGIGVAEAAAAGLPVVASDAVDAALLLSERSRRIVPTNSSAAVAEAISEILSDFAGRRQSAQEDAVREFGWDAVAHRWLTAMR